MRYRNSVLRTRMLIVLLTLSLYSCEEKVYYGSVDCSECYQIKPDSADLVVKVTINDIYPEVPLTFYRGNIEAGEIEYVDTAYGTNYYLWVPVDKDFSVKAEYKRGNTTIYAVDGTKIEVLKVPDACDEVCYIVDDEVIDVRLNSKYQ